MRLDSRSVWTIAAVIGLCLVAALTLELVRQPSRISVERSGIAAGRDVNVQGDFTINEYDRDKERSTQVKLFADLMSKQCATYLTSINAMTVANYVPFSVATPGSANRFLSPSVIEELRRRQALAEAAWRAVADTQTATPSPAYIDLMPAAQRPGLLQKLAAATRAFEGLKPAFVDATTSYCSYATSLR